MRQILRKKSGHGWVFCLNFASSFKPVYLCTLIALLIYQRSPIFERQALNVLTVAACFILPWLGSGALAHVLLARFSSRNVVFYTRLTGIATALLTAFCLEMIPGIGYTPLFFAAGVLGLEWAIYRAALKVHAATRIPVKSLAMHCAVIDAATFFGITLGTVLAVAVLYFQLVPGRAALLAAAVSFLEVIFATQLPAQTSPAVEVRPLIPELEQHQRYRELVLTGVSECYVFAAIILAASLAIEYIGLRYPESLRSLLREYSLMAASVIGAAAGSLAAGVRSRGKIEIGMVPTGALLMVITGLLIGNLSLIGNYYWENILLTVLLFVFGFASGGVLIPVQSYQAYFIRRDLAAGFFSWFYLPFGIGLLLTVGVVFVTHYYHIPVFTVLLGFALLTMLLGGIIFALMPQFLLRLLMRLLLVTFYRLRIFHADRLPEHGPALLVANRASFVDMLFISACTNRPIRFLLHEHYYRMPVLHGLFRAVGFLEVPSHRPKQLKKMLEQARELLRRGELICVFPEDDITRNGAMSQFHDGVDVLLPDDVDVPVLPMRIGMTWGSIFSCAYTGKQRFRLPGRHRHPASVTIGEPMPRHTSAYEMRIILSELAASTELIPDRDECPLHTAFARQAKHHPLKRTVMECSHGRWQRPGNLKLLIRMVVLSRCFRRLCANDGEYVGIMLPNTLAYAVTFIAIHMANKTPAVLNFTVSREALAGAVQQARLRHVITSRVFLTRQRIPETPEMVFLEDIMAGGGGFRKHLGWFLACLLLPADELMRQVSPENWNDVRRNGVLIFSSGSTGRPKGIMLSHHNIIADVHSISTTLCWQRNDSVLGNLPLFHSFGMTVCLWLPLITGTKTVLIPNPLDAALTGLALRTEKISLLCATPGFLQLYMRRCVPEDFKSLRIVITGAEKLRDDIAENFRRMTGIVITEGYGCTELSPVVTINLAPTASELGSRVIERGSIGPSLIGVCAKVVDPSTFELMPENTDGLLIVTGAIVMRGYLNDPEKTKEVIRDGWYITGDIARMNRRGFITITGRLSRFSKIAGEMVPHELVERELNNILQPDDRLLAVCGAADPDPGRGERLLVFYTDGERLAPELVVRELRERGIPNLWIPRPENFIQVPELPVLGSGKLDLEKLKIMAAAVCAGENRGCPGNCRCFFPETVCKKGGE